MELKLSKQIIDGVNLYCSKNNIDNVEDFVYQCFKQGYDIKKYGFLGEPLNEGEKQLKTSGIEEKWVEKEVIVEKLVEIPVEVIKEVIVEKEIIKEVEKIIEVPVEKVVTKIEYISDKTTEDELGGIITNLKNEMSKKNEELDELRRNLDIILDKPPVEIIKEVEVIREVENSEKLKLMGETLQKLRKELSDKNKKIEELEKINQRPKDAVNAIFMKGSNLKDLL
jgi:predicted RNase H-like nuclease (RuvC/YqgF family)